MILLGFKCGYYVWDESSHSVVLYGLPFLEFWERAIPEIPMVCDEEEPFLLNSHSKFPISTPDFQFPFQFLKSKT